MPYRDKERQRLAVRAATARWYERNRDDETFLDHRAEASKKHRAQQTDRTRARRAEQHEANVEAAIAGINPRKNETNDHDSGSDGA